MSVKNSQVARSRRKQRIRKKVHGTAERPRMTVYRASGHMYVQIIDDDAGHTLVSASTVSSEMDSFEGHRGNILAAQEVGRLAAQKALASSVSKVVFDRNGFLYHGRVKALADAAREAGLEF